MAEAARDRPLVLLAAGGTGGHLFPAEALAAALARRGIDVDLATDARAARFAKGFPARRVHVIRSETLRGRDPVALGRMALQLGLGYFDAARVLKAVRPAAVVGFGGYPTLPPVVAAARRKIPTVIHEQNGVMGRANRLLAPFVTAIGTGFPGAVASGKAAAKATPTGNPLRPAVLAAAGSPYAPPVPDTGPVRLVVFGGSQGARVMSDVVPAGVGTLAPALRERLAIVQQAREEDIARVDRAYGTLGVAAEVRPFFADIPARIAAAHLIIARSGAGTVSELAAIGRPAILVPLPHALDQDQRANAGVLERAGGAIRIDQQDFTPERLAREVTLLVGRPERLAAMAAAAASVAVVDAAERLADLVTATAGLKGTRTT